MTTGKKVTRNVAKFLKINATVPVISGSASPGGGGFYRLANSEGFQFTLEEARMLPEGYPKWPWDMNGEKP